MIKQKRIPWIAILVIVLDQLTKFLISNNLNILDTITVIKNFFYLTYTTNTGGAWSILEGKQLLLIFISIIFLIILVSYLKKEEQENKLSIIGYNLIIGGIIGNLIDRIFLQHVIDFLSFIIINYHFPIFNIADTAIVVGILLLIIEQIRSEIDERTKSRRD